MYLIIFILLLFVIIYLLMVPSSAENLAVPPWGSTACHQKCIQQGAQIPWDGGPQGPWDDPGAEASSTFDVAGCIENCNQALWGI